MAKKYPRKSNLKLAVDKTILRLYNLGFLHSFVWHLVLLLWLALLYPVLNQKIDRLSPISISFTKTSEMVEANLENFPTIEEAIDIVQPSEDTASSTMVADNITSMAEHDENSLSANIESLDLQAPEQIEEDYKANSLTQEIKELMPEQPKKIERTSSPRTKSRDKQKNSSLLGLPTSFLQEGGENMTQGVPNLSDKADTGEIGKRLEQYGAQTGDVQISLAWDTTDDLDLHVIVRPINSHINWMNKQGQCGGVLDIDMNFHPNLLNNRPIENIFWARGAAPHAEYVVGVHYYMSWSRMRQVKGTILIKADGKTQSFPFTVTYGQPLTPITSFRR